MTGRDVRRYVDDLLNGRRPRSFRPDDDDAEQMRAAITLSSARLGADTPSESFLTDLQQRLAAEIDEPAPDGPGIGAHSTRRRQILIGTSVAAAAAAVGAVVDHAFVGGVQAERNETAADATLEPTTGAWRAVAASADVPEGATVAFDVGTISGFVHRVDGQPQAVSGICTHQGCRLWLDAPAERLRCPCHSTSFSIAGQVLSHQLPVTPAPLPHLQIRENGGTIEVFAPTEPA
ncbi:MULTISPECIES: Rieske (2Fe-2S) protein [unclassified Rhodococcus (in: high G+C Gram-positive bacteria)]|uniref:Rieske (2Fe-2S) protein n=1 Tax=unclassified Rhodococcus (in: high G+C Gram-positive bacteria) TaxID=192944 RepID=UPI00163B2D34|nr:MULTISPECIES: Rieske (2Fe-2S) protein [unclassified Rhodococcus (in: high G+C Gram-positive bacteria)]MBC2644212.1 Rieske (2Fe-2S) protein [Rhodococcus sp. 3A]MBC2891049.1 Rieske (2Fe-2S) protein [Rhodococcus sp. 4CII]